MAQTYPTADGNLTDDVLDRLALDADAVALARRVDGEWHDVTIGEFHREVTDLAKGLIASGVEPGDRVVLLSKTRYEWTLADYAIWWAGAVTVPVYETSSPAQIAWILADSGAVAAVVETPEHAARVEEARTDAPDLRHVWTIDASSPGEGLDAAIEAGADTADNTLDGRRKVLGPDSLATLIYTSGTTGRPKGCQLTHGNFRAELAGALDRLPELFDREGASTLLFLPLAHVFARVIQVGAIRAGAKLGHPADIRYLVNHLGEF